MTNYKEQIFDILRKAPGSTAQDVLEALNIVRAGDGVPSISTVRRYLQAAVEDGQLYSQTVGANTKKFSLHGEPAQSQTRQEFEDHELAEQHTIMAAHGFEIPPAVEPQSDTDTGFSTSGADFSQPKWAPREEVPLRGVKPTKRRKKANSSGHSGKRSPGASRSRWFHLPRSARG